MTTETFKKSPWCDYPTILDHVQTGDLIECDEMGIMRHWAVYIGSLGANHYIVHRSGNDKADAVIKQELIQVLFLNRKCRVNNYLDERHSPNPPEVIVDRAISRVRQALVIGVAVATGSTLAGPSLIGATIESGSLLGSAASLGGPSSSGTSGSLGGSASLLLG
uniref:LRAT domain-containing protein n=1 Tax=Panagrolaimus sp. ES5 TaxID=591445 RepID=A0AC34FW37_9BILA